MQTTEESLLAMANFVLYLWNAGISSIQAFQQSN